MVGHLMSLGALWSLPFGLLVRWPGGGWLRMWLNSTGRNKPPLPTVTYGLLGPAKDVSCSGGGFGTIIRYDRIFDPYLP